MDGVSQAAIETKKENPGAAVANQATSVLFPQLHTPLPIYCIHIETPGEGPISFSSARVSRPPLVPEFEGLQVT